MVPKVSQRHFLKEKDVKQLLLDFSKRLKIEVEQLLGSKPNIEIVEAQNTKIFIIDRKPLLAKANDELFPMLVFDRLFPFLPKIVVDMGAVPHVCNGADVMAPGVIRIEGDFNKNDFLLITDERHRKPLAIGVALFNSQATKNLQHGKIVKTIHYVGDRLWNASKKI